MEGEWSMVLELLRTMHETGPDPDAATYLTVLNTLKNHGRCQEVRISVISGLGCRVEAPGSSTRGPSPEKCIPIWLGIELHGAVDARDRGVTVPRGDSRCAVDAV